MPTPQTGTPATGVLNSFLIVRGALTATTRRLVCMNLSIPNPAPAERVLVKPEGTLVAVLRANDVESTGSFDLLVASFVDPTQPTMDEIINGTGAGASWEPINGSMEVHVETSFRCFYFDFYIDGRKMGTSGRYTKRTVEAYAAPAASFARADPNVLSYELTVYGAITDSVVTIQAA